VLRLRRLSRPAVLLRWLAVAVVCAIAVAYVQPLRAYLDAREDVDARRVERRELLEQRELLRRKLAQAGTDEFVAREARLLGLVRPGERLVVVKGAAHWQRSQAP